MTIYTLYFCDKSGTPKRPLTKGLGSNLTCDYRTLDEAIAARDHAYAAYEAHQSGRPFTRDDAVWHNHLNNPPRVMPGRIAVMKVESQFRNAEQVA